MTKTKQLKVSRPAFCRRWLAVLAAGAITFSGVMFGAVPATLSVLSATDSTNDAGNVAANAIDSSLGTRWSANGNGQWLCLNLGATQNIGSVNIAWYQGNQRQARFDLQTSDDGTNWTTVYTGASSGTTTNFESYPVIASSGRYLRVLGHGNNLDLWNSITEVRATAPAAGSLAGLRFLANPAVSNWNGSVNNAGVALNWKLPTNAVYQVQVSSNLLSWQTVGAPLTNSGAPRMWVDTVSNLSAAAWPRRYYRVTLLDGTTNATVVASFSASPSATTPLTVQFTDQSAGNPVSWNWSFGDGATSTAQNPSHTYTSAGTYTAALTVAAGGGQTSSASRSVSVTNLVLSTPLTADFSATPTSGQEPLTVQFTDLSAGGPVSWSWNFGDGTTSTVQNPSHIYANAGTWTATLTVLDSAGNSSSKSATIQVSGLALNVLPAQVLNILNWKLTLPIGTQGSPTEITQPALATYVNANYFALNAAGDGVVFTAPCGGVTTSGSGYPRSELREMANNGTTPASWSTTSGTSTMEVTEAITHLPVVKPQVIAGQIHDGVTKVIDCRLEGSTLYMEDASGGNIVTLDTNYQLGTKFTFKWVVQNGGIAIYYNGNYVTTYNVTDSGCYFKCGDYTQSNTSKGDAATAYGQVVVYSVNFSHQ